VLETESRRLEEMARSFSQFGKLPEGAASDVDIGELARAASRSLGAGRVPVVVTVEDDLPLVRGHYDALARALSNILINAVEACGEDDRVDVRVDRRVRDGHEMVEVRVRDTGVGIPAQRLGTIWEPYVTNKPGGTGLGLAIARQTVLAHRGRVEANSTEGEGTEIVLALPVNGTSETSPAETSFPGVADGL
jgi:signal transduction histidine kinase